MNIFVDMEGVLADFDAGYHQAFGEYPCGVGAEGEEEREKWEKVNSRTGFFLYLPRTPWCSDLWSVLKPTGAHILTSYSHSCPDSMGHKIKWCQRELGIGTDRIVCVHRKRNKFLYCQPGDILLDDHAENVRQWNEAGGTGLLVTRDHNVDAAITALMLWRKTLC